MAADEEHFVDTQRKELVQRVALVEPILDDLYHWKLLTREQYDKVCSKATTQEQMRQLYRQVESFGNDGKNRFLESLREHNAALIRDLESKQANLLDSKMNIR
ncbi:apoptosis-associated speck-like protein containing a CARD isoform X2 [Dendropsophus ebraccatus]|uniref:apoptosis-associated speck-like protein containing a CARD isoform X2 n=1 Tax=Dendropsophus ebraccatus TaxID=150705 RepID=UPI0038317920